MTLEELAALFEKHEDVYLKSNEIDGPADLAAFNLINKLLPSKKDMIACAEHDEFWLSAIPEKMAEVASEEDIIFLIKCGVRYDEDTDSFAFFA